MRLVDASQIMEDMSSGVRPGDVSKLNKLHQKIKSKMRRDA